MWWQTDRNYEPTLSHPEIADIVLAEDRKEPEFTYSRLEVTPRELVELIKQKKKQLPLFINVCIGFCGLDGMHTYATGDKMIVHSIIKQKRVVALDEKGRYISIPKDYEGQFLLLHHSIDGTRPMSLEEILDTELQAASPPVPVSPEPPSISKMGNLAELAGSLKKLMTVRFKAKKPKNYTYIPKPEPDPAEIKVIRFAQEMSIPNPVISCSSSSDFGDLVILDIYEEQYLCGHPITYGKCEALHNDVMPVYLPVKLQEVCGIEDLHYSLWDKVWYHYVENIHIPVDDQYRYLELSRDVVLLAENDVAISSVEDYDYITPAQLVIPTMKLSGAKQRSTLPQTSKSQTQFEDPCKNRPLPGIPLDERPLPKLPSTSPLEELAKIINTSGTGKNRPNAYSLDPTKPELLPREVKMPHKQKKTPLSAKPPPPAKPKVLVPRQHGASAPLSPLKTEPGTSQSTGTSLERTSDLKDGPGGSKSSGRDKVLQINREDIQQEEKIYGSIHEMPHNVELYTIQEVQEALDNLNLSQYKDSFLENEVDGELLVDYCEAGDILETDLKMKKVEALRLRKFVLKGWRPNVGGDTVYSSC